MKWIKFTLDTHTDAVDILSYMLDEIGVEGIEIEDHLPLSESEKKQMYVDILPDPETNDGSARVHFYMEPQDCNPEKIMLQVHEIFQEMKAYTNIGNGTVSLSETEDKDWINNWKQYFKPFTVDNILIKPTWEEIPEEHKDKLLIQIDPGTAFGTGMHETTQLCIRQLQHYITSESRVLDVGTGSGILGIAALLLGAKEVKGTDLDENAISAVHENMASNQIAPERFQVIQGNIIEDKNVQEWAGTGYYDIVVANILAPVIILLQEEIPVHLKKGGIFITSGIINTKEEDVRRAIASNKELELVDIARQGEWVSIIARRR